MVLEVGQSISHCVYVVNCCERVILIVFGAVAESGVGWFLTLSTWVRMQGLLIDSF